MPPGAPKLTIDGKPVSAGDVLSDSEWEDLPDEEPEERTQTNLKRIAEQK